MTTTTDQISVANDEAIEAMSGRLFMEGLGGAHIATVYLGHRLGLWTRLHETPAVTAAQLAKGLGLDTWYVREWLQAETIAGLIIADDEDLEHAHFQLAPGVAESLVNETHPAYLAGLPVALAVVGKVLPDLLSAFGTGAGVSYESYGPEAVEAQAALNRPAFVNDLTSTWLPAIPDVHARLNDTTDPALVADIGCGVGWAAIELAKGYPHIRIEGFDADAESLNQARRNAKEHGVDDRVTFQLVDASSAAYLAKRYDLVLFLECVHDFGRPVEALAAARAAVADGGSVIVMDERTGETRGEPGDPIESLFALYSVLWCLPQSRVVPDCEAPGTVMRPATLEAIAQRAGWAGFEVLPIEHPTFRFYRLVGAA